jgi:hypothetical protein
MRPKEGSSVSIRSESLYNAYRRSARTQQKIKNFRREMNRVPWLLFLYFVLMGVVVWGVSL